MSESLKNYILWFFFFNDTATTEIYTLSLHDALPICRPCSTELHLTLKRSICWTNLGTSARQPKLRPTSSRSEEHTSELQSRQYLVCRLLLEKKKIHLLVSLVLISLINLPIYYISLSV